jgi:signal peptidase
VRWASRILDAVVVVLVLALLGLQLGPLVLPYRVFTVLSGSMEPTLPIGSEVIDIAVPAARIHVGDVITFPHPRLPGAYVTHRVVAITSGTEGPTFETKGDANGIRDPWTLKPDGTVLRVVADVPWLGYVLNWLSGPQAHLALVALIVVAALAFLAQLWGRRTD